MNSIRGTKARSSLRKTKTAPRPYFLNTTNQERQTEHQSIVNNTVDQLAPPVTPTAVVGGCNSNLQSEFLQSEQWSEALKTLDLKLDEVIHIRSVLTRAELESLSLDGTMKVGDQIFTN